MAALASIPEANNTLANTKNTTRPRSRVIFLSKRPGRARCPVRTPALSKRHGINRAAETLQHAEDNKAQPRNNNNLAGVSGAVAASAPLKAATSSQQVTVKDVSDTSFDMDSFPHPPSSSMSSHIEPLRRHASDMKSHELRLSPKPPPALAQRKLLVPKQQTRANMRNSVVEAVNGLSSSNHTSVDSAVIEAISRSIAQQLRLVSTTRRGKREVSKFSVTSASPDGAASRTPSQKRALNRFTRDLEAYANITGAAGKTLIASPTPLASAATLNTVSALMPYRPELRAAGLAVTSKDQEKYLKTTINSRRPPKQGQGRAGCDANPSQLDGHGPSGSSNTEISFAESHKMDEWRYALIDEAPERKRKKARKKKQPARGCLPCFPGGDDMTTDPEWAHFKPVRASARKIVRKVSAADPKTRPLAKNEVRKAPRQAICDGDTCSSDTARPQQGLKAVDARSKPAHPVHEQPGGSNFITTGRRHSMAIPKGDIGSMDCNIRHRRRNIETRYPKDSLVYMSGLANAGPRNSRQQLGQVDVTREAGPRRSNVFQSRQVRGAVDAPPRANLQTYAETDTLSEHQVDGLSGRLAATTGVIKSTRQKRVKPRQKTQDPQFKYDPYHSGICCPSTRGVPAKAIARPNIPKRTSSIKESASSLDMDYDDGEIADRDVLRGLHLAASAACNEEVDAFVRIRTGLRVRKFLADLMVLETLTAALPNERAEQHARRRRAEMRKLKQQVRRSREIAMTRGLI